MNWRALTFIFTILLNILSGQPDHFRHFNRDNGLHKQYVYNITQAPSGLLYIATGEGVSAFNGHSFTEIFNGRETGRFISTLFYDSKSVLWMGQQQNGLSYLRDGLIYNLTDPALLNVKVTHITEDSFGRIWFSTAGAGLWSIDSLYRLHHQIKSPEYIWSFAFGADGALLAGGNEGLTAFTIAGNREVSVGKLIRGFADVPVLQVCSFRNGYWVLAGESIFYLEKSKKSGQLRIKHSPEQLPELSVAAVSCIETDAKGNLWVGTTGNGIELIKFEGKGSGLKAFRKTIGPGNGFPADNIRQIYRDIEGNIWFGTYGEGLVQKPVTRFLYYGPGEEAGGKNITSIVPDSDSALWLGSNNGLFHFHKVRNEWTHAEQTEGLRIISATTDKKGLLWLGTDEGLFTFDRRTLQLTDISGQGISRVQTVNFISAYKDQIYVCSSNGLFIFREPGDFEWLNTNEGLLHNNVNHVFTDSHSRIWISSNGAPPYYFNDGKVVAFRSIGGMRSFNINSCSEDSAGNIWLATEGDGVFRYDGNEFRQYTASDGVLSEYCAGILTDRENSVWLTHRSGISRKKENGRGFNNYSRNNGLVHYRCNPHAAYADPTGNIWFGMSDGLVKYDVTQETSVPAPTKIVRVHADQLDYAPGEELKLKYGHYTIRFDFLSVSLADPAATIYRYRLLGADTNWNYTEQRFVEFPQLTDGKFMFEVSAVNNSNDWGVSIPDSMRITVSPPFWRSFWFYLLLLLAVASVTYIIVQVRLRVFRKRQALLELKVKQKTFLLQREKDAVETIKLVVEQKNKDITDSINYAKKIQDSILPPDELLHNMFGSNYFVLFQPKDIVSGDFYWAASLNVNENNKTPLSLAAVIDCTGHGVPGAFLSIMANDFLRQSIIDNSVNMPHDVLNFLNEKISSHLNQTAKSRIRDGMDLALIGIDHKKKILYFSGANNPVYIYRKTETEINQIILTATKQAIGYISGETTKFTLREFRLLPGDMVYLFSDGYADQFGGTNNKKFTYKRFRELLEDIYELPPEGQKQRLNAQFQEWKQDEAQTDDICVMGIRIE